MNESLLRDVRSGNLTLFFGAGASAGCKSSDGSDVPMSDALAAILADEAGYSYAHEPLDQVYEAVKIKLGDRLNALLEKRFRHVQPSPEYVMLAKYPWRRIYTLNIDDGLDQALVRNSPQRVRVFCAQDSLRERDAFFQELDYVKLNGSIDRLRDGLIFSPSEYAQATAKHLPWYTQCASDFIRAPVLFIGTKLNEPLLKFHIERYQTENSSSPGRSYLLVREASEIQTEALRRYNIEVICGTLLDFVDWLRAQIPDVPTPMDLAEQNLPQVRAMYQSGDPRRFASLFNEVTLVRREHLPGVSGSVQAGSTVREFYKGFKPTWEDIVQEVPAELDVLEAAWANVQSIGERGRLLPILGPAGSGKTTLLKQLCWRGFQSGDWDVYYIEAEPYSLPATLEAIEDSSKADSVLVGIDNLELSVDHIHAALKGGRLRKTLLLGAEREAIWNRRGRDVLSDYTLAPVFARDFSETDAERLLARLQRYGTWTHLGKLSDRDRKKALLDRARKQLLIALLEATLGRGFEQIIEDDYRRVASDYERLFLVTIALATDRRCEAPLALIDRALEKMGILRDAGRFAQDLTGIVTLHEGKVVARHPVYAHYLVDRVIDPTLTVKAVNGLLQAFADYAAPVIKHVPKSEANLYKSLINHNFLFEVLRGQEEKIISTYSQLEKKFESDGLFWLQYGLALRDFRRHPEALEKLQVAFAAYPMDHTEHALAQQMLIVAMESKDKNSALNMAEEARKTLERLDQQLRSDDTYPIVTLADLYTAVTRNHKSVAEARVLAQSFARVLEQRLKQHPNHRRLRTSYERMFKLASTGTWTELTADDLS